MKNTNDVMEDITSESAEEEETRWAEDKKFSSLPMSSGTWNTFGASNLFAPPQENWESDIKPMTWEETSPPHDAAALVRDLLSASEEEKEIPEPKRKKRYKRHYKKKDVDKKSKKDDEKKSKKDDEKKSKKDDEKKPKKDDEKKVKRRPNRYRKDRDEAAEDKPE